MFSEELKAIIEALNALGAQQVETQRLLRELRLALRKKRKAR